MKVQVILNMEVSTEEAAYADIKHIVEGPRCESFEIKKEEQVQHERMCQDELLEHLRASCQWEEDFEDTLHAIGYTDKEVKAIMAEHA